MCQTYAIRYREQCRSTNTCIKGSCTTVVHTNYNLCYFSILEGGRSLVYDAKNLENIIIMYYPIVVLYLSFIITSSPSWILSYMIHPNHYHLWSTSYIAHICYSVHVLATHPHMLSTLINHLIHLSCHHLNVLSINNATTTCYMMIAWWVFYNL